MLYVTAGSTVLCGLVLLVSAVSKIRSSKDYTQYVASVPAFGIPSRWTSLFAAVTVAAEIAITGLLLPAALLIAAGSTAGRWLAGAGLVLAAGLFTVLTAAVWRAVTRRSGAVCRCFGAARTVLAHRHVVRNALLLLAAVIGVISLSVLDTVDTVDTVDTADPAIAALAAVVGTLGAVLVIRFDDLAELIAGPVPSTR